MPTLVLSTASGDLAIDSASAPGDGVFVLSEYDGADPTGATYSQDALETALADAIAYGPGARLDLGGSTNTWKFYPQKRYDTNSVGGTYNYPVCILLKGVAGLTISGTAADNRPQIRMDAAPEIDGGSPPRDPAAFITRRGEFLHVDDCSSCTFRWFKVDGQAPPTVATNNWGLPEYGWDYSHKGSVVQYGSYGINFLVVDMQDFRSEFVYTNGDPPYVGTIVIDGGTFSGTTASMFSCTASLTVQNLTVRRAPQGIENYAYSTMDTVVYNCDVDTSMVTYQSYDSVYLNMQTGVTYEIEDNSGGADWTNVGAPNNDVGTTFTATSNDAPTSWGTGQLSRATRGNGLVIFNQRGAGTVTISNTTVTNCDNGILMTDFGHNWTISGCTFTDVDQAIATSSLATSSSSSDYHLFAGWRDFTLTNNTVVATGRTVASFIQADGSNQKNPYVQSAEATLTGYYSVTSHDSNGKHSYTQVSSTGTIAWTGTQWEIAKDGTTYYSSTDDVFCPYDVTTWTQVDGSGTPVVTIHSPRDWTINGLTITEENGFGVQSVVRSKVGIEGCTVSNVDATGTNPIIITAGESPVHYLPRWDGTCTLPARVDYVNSDNPDSYTPRWGNVSFNSSPGTLIEIEPTAVPYIPDDFTVTAKSSNATEITLNFEGSGGPDSTAFTNAATKTLIFDKPTETWSEVV
jgi:hypothetical protein